MWRRAVVTQLSRGDVSVTLSHVYLLSLNCNVFSPLALILDPATKYEVSVISVKQIQVSDVKVTLKLQMKVQD